MRGVQIVLALFVALPAPALACSREPELVMSRLGDADLIVVGEVSNYRPTPDFNDPIIAAYHYELLERALVSTPEKLEQIKRQIRFEFARIDVRVTEVLQGTLPEGIEVTWDTSWFRLPDSLEEGSYLMALEAPGKLGRTPARAKSWTVLSPICEQSFLIPSSSEAAAAIREHLRNTRNRKPGDERTK